jgi:putative Holliday junction resolvase
VVLGFDWGTQKIGVAVGQSATGTATPLPPLRAVQGIPDWSEVERLVEAWRPDLMIVGIPLNMDGSESESSHRATRFARRLSARLDIPWAGVDERLSSAEARYDGLVTGASPRSVDSMAARLLVESWFRQNPEPTATA